MLVESGDFKGAQAALKKAITLNPRMMPAHMALGDARRFLGDWDQAIVTCRQALALQRTPLILNKLASTLRVIGKNTVSESLYHEALRIDPDFTLTKVNLATIYTTVLS